MSHATENEPRLITKKAQELLGGDYVINGGEVDRVLSVERQFNSDHSDLAGRARLINAWDRVNRLVS